MTDLGEPDLPTFYVAKSRLKCSPDLFLQVCKIEQF
jgi:hypothetical protein